DLSLALGPLYLGFDGLGLALTLEFGSEHGNLGGANLGTALRLPTGVALALDTPVASGGGLVIVDYEAGEYAGVLDVELFDVGVTAIALLATKLPSGSGAWSLLASLSATFTGLQLGFGFTLNGVGGLIGANRGLDEDALASGIRSGALDGLLFPEDPVRDAARILADMNTVFPVAEGQWVLGPIVKIGWGTPSIIELDLGVIVQLPDPLTISLLGTLSCVLPDDDAAILQLNVDFAGTLNLSEGTLKVDASLRESKVAGFALTGDMAVRAAFIDQPSFLISFGGFHPEFSPPASFPKLARLAIALDTGDDLRVQLGGYFALTSNTLQFGAKAEFWAKAKGLTATGGTSFDALIQFKPFRFSIALKVWVDVRAKDVELLAILLAGKLEGPKPWYIQGVASFKILGVKTRFEVEATIGRAADQKPRELVRVEDLLIEDLRREGAWSVVPPAHDGEGVITCDAGTGPLRVHPAGRIEVRQRVVPLGRRIDHYGEAKLGGADTFTLTGARIGSSSVASEDIDEWFAAAQYWSLKPAEKLSSPSFEQLPGGVRLGDDELDAGEASPFTIDREVVYRDPLARAESRERPGTVVKATALALQRALGLGSSRAARSQAGLPRSTAKPATLSVGSVRYVAVDELSGTAASKRASTSFYAVRDAAAGETATRVVPAYELELSK
ncbi:MAG TPA: DUF6603 domain-containing protein, partial [Enhygromyxa sp.]|nr:DUF6603 domain-containing protein [Enhygromyxa sp.]